jgi:regulator of cell morphogenesis and NO signaling
MTTAETTLAELAATKPAAAHVFFSHGLDFCCHGRRPLAQACADKGLDPAGVIEEIEVRSAPASGDLSTWTNQPVPELVHHIVLRYHDRLRADLPVLIAMADKVEARHADKDTVPRGLANHLRSMSASAIEHLDKEERILFPAILGGHGASLGAPIQCLEQEHVDHGDNLARTRALTRDLVPPPEACATWRALYAGLTTMEQELMEHIHLENNVLFPRVLAG